MTTIRPVMTNAPSINSRKKSRNWQRPHPAAVVNLRRVSWLWLYLNRLKRALSCDGRRCDMMESFLKVFRKLDEIDFRNSGSGSKNDPVRFDPGNRCVLIDLPADSLEVLSRRERA